MSSFDYYRARRQFDREWVERLMLATNGAINQSAKLAGISKVLLIKKVRESGFDAAALREEHAKNKKAGPR